MNPDLALPLALTFIAVALATWSATSLLLARNAPERRRLVAAADRQAAGGSGQPDPRRFPDGKAGDAIRSPSESRGNPQRCPGCSSASKRPAGAIPKPPATTARRRPACLIVFGLTPLLVVGHRGVGSSRWSRPWSATCIPDLLLARATRALSEGHSEWTARRARPDCRLRRSRIEPRSGHRARQRGAGDRAARARARSCAR